jgi:hypothetical protein
MRIRTLESGGNVCFKSILCILHWFSYSVLTAEDLLLQIQTNVANLITLEISDCIPYLRMYKPHACISCT